MEIKVLTPTQARQKTVGLTMTSNRESFDRKQREVADKIKPYKEKAIKKKPSKFLKRISQGLSKPLSNRSIIKSDKATVVINEPKIASHWEETSRYFND